MEFKFDTIYPNFELYLEQAKRISSMGTTLRRLERYRNEIADAISRGAEARILFVDTKEEALYRYAKIQHRGRGDQRNIKEFLKERQDNADWWFDLKYSDEAHDSQIEIRQVDYPPSIGIDLLELKDGSAHLYLRSYPLMHSEGKRGPEEDDRPIVTMVNTDGFWYRRYCDQFERHWALAGHSWDLRPKRSTR